MLGGGLGLGEIQMGREVITDVVLVPAEPRRVETRAPGSAVDRRMGTSLHAGSSGQQTVGMQETARGGSTGHDLVPWCRDNVIHPD